MRQNLIFTILILLTLSCVNKGVEPLSNSSYVELVFTNIQTEEIIESGVHKISPITSRLKSGIYYKGPNYYLTKDISFEIHFPNGEIYDAILSFHKREEAPDLIDRDNATESWSYLDPHDYLPYYKDHFNRMIISKRESGSNIGGTGFPISYEASSVLIDGVNKTKLEISLNNEFVNSSYLPRSEQRGFYANGRLIIVID